MKFNLFRKKEETTTEQAEVIEEPKMKEEDPMSLKARLKRWWMIHFQGYVFLREFRIVKDPDDPYDCEMIVSMMKKEDLPAGAVHCSGESYVYSLDHAKIVHDPHDNGFSAIEACLYLQFDGFQDCLSKTWTEFDHIDIKKILLVGGVVLAVVIVFLLLRGH